jgi:dTDP-4-dehydrorhamnose reductase
VKQKNHGKRVLVTGGSGQLGQELDLVMSNYDVQHWCLDISEMDITCESKVREVLRGLEPSIVIHAAAYTSVDKCEKDQAKAMAVNTDATGRLARFCGYLGIPLVYISTDFVFDGEKGCPYGIDDATKPLNVYGTTKLKGEQQVKMAGEDHWIIRTSWLYSTYGGNFPKAILRMAASGTAPRVVNDQVGSPTYARDLAKAVCKLAGVIPNEVAGPYGVYHFSNRGACSWWEFAREILVLSGWLEHEPRLAPEPITSLELARPAVRPAYSVLSLGKIESVNIKSRDWREALAQFIQELRASSPELFPTEKV